MFDSLLVVNDHDQNGNSGDSNNIRRGGEEEGRIKLLRLKKKKKASKRKQACDNFFVACAILQSHRECTLKWFRVTNIQITQTLRTHGNHS